MIYLNYLELAINIDTENHVYTFMREGRGTIARDVALSFVRSDGTVAFNASNYPEAEYKIDSAHAPYRRCTLYLKGGKGEMPETVTVSSTVFRDRIEMRASGLFEGLTAVFEGDLIFGDIEDSFAVCLNRSDEEHDLRSALGPAVSVIDDALFDRRTDEALTVDGGIGRELGFSWEKNCYTFKVKGDLTVGYLPQVYTQKFRIRYNPINKNNTFPKPPAGFMTWYSVKFDACEKAVLENAAKQKEYFADYGADTIWVDWEWYHSNLKGQHVSDDIGYMSPDPVRYPNGLKYVSDKIRELGFVPALWVAPTVEPDNTVTVKKYADSVYLEKPSWCGRYFFDITDERVRDELIPEAFAKVTEWGYDALKWDCLPITLIYADEFHDTLKHPEMTSTEALRAVCEKARETVGKDFYMLSCSGIESVIMMATETFDAARIGEDIFSWADFIREFLEKVLVFYPFHNTVMYCDPDNVVVREEFNTLDQAKARVSSVALLGLPTTFGDDLRELPMDRVDIIRRALPTFNAHPKDIREGAHDGKRLLVNLAINRPYEAWNVVSVLNLLENEAETAVELKKDLKLADGEYLVYDYWNGKYVGCVSDSISLTLPPTACAVLSVRRKLERPQILSTSRHITQGAVDLKAVAWDEQSHTLTVTADVVKGDPYRIHIYVPDGFTPVCGKVEDNVLTITPDTSVSGEVTVTIKFN